MAAPPPPPPRRTASPAVSSASSPAPGDGGGWKGKLKARGAVWGKKAMDKGQVWSDNIGGKVNDIAENKLGGNAFWPTTGDLPKEMDKCARILRVFTEQGIVAEETKDSAPSTPNPDGTPSASATASSGKKPARKVKVLRKIPPEVIAQAKGLAIFSAFRSGIAPLGGAGGAGVVVARLEDGSWSAPASISPNNLAGGFLLGMDMYDAVLVLRTAEAVASFKSHKVTLGAEIGVAAGPYGAGFSAEAGLEKAPIFSYVKSRGMYAGIEAVGQVFVERFDENAAFYCWPGIKGGDILAGKVKPPKEAAALYAALADAETGRAQAQTQGGKLDTIVGPDTQIELKEGEVLNLPPTPDQMDGSESVGAYGSVDTRRRAPPAPPAVPARRVPPPPAPSSSSVPAPDERPGVVHHDSGRSEYSQPSPPLAAAGYGQGQGQQQGGYYPPSDDAPGYDAPAYDSGYPAHAAPTAALAGAPAGLPGYASSGAAMGPDEYPQEKGDSQARVLAAAGVLENDSGEGSRAPAYDYAPPSGDASASAPGTSAHGQSGEGVYGHDAIGAAYDNGARPDPYATQAPGTEGEVEAARLGVERTRI